MFICRKLSESGGQCVKAKHRKKNDLKIEEELLCRKCGIRNQVDTGKLLGEHRRIQSRVGINHNKTH